MTEQLAFFNPVRYEDHIAAVINALGCGLDDFQSPVHDYIRIEFDPMDGLYQPIPTGDLKSQYRNDALDHEDNFIFWEQIGRHNCNRVEGFVQAASRLNDIGNTAILHIVENRRFHIEEYSVGIRIPDITTISAFTPGFANEVSAYQQGNDASFVLMGLRESSTPTPDAEGFSAGQETQVIYERFERVAS